MRLLVTADLHYNHPRSRPLAETLIHQMNAVSADVLLVVGDTASADGDALERCLDLFRFDGPKLFVAGNHELWTHGPDSYALLRDALPRRVQAMGWHWLEDQPFTLGNFAIVGSIGWYDYSYAHAELGIPLRFYEHKVSPGAAARLGQYAGLLSPGDDIAPAAIEICSRWNDGRFVKLGRSDPAFLDELLQCLAMQLHDTRSARHVIAAVHHVPFVQLLPPHARGQWAFARAYLGSARIGTTLLRAANLRLVLCGHSHLPAEADIGSVRAINIGSGYRLKRFRVLDL